MHALCYAGKRYKRRFEIGSLLFLAFLLLLSYILLRSELSVILNYLENIGLIACSDDDELNTFFKVIFVFISIVGFISGIIIFLEIINLQYLIINHSDSFLINDTSKYNNLSENLISITIHNSSLNFNNSSVFIQNHSILLENTNFSLDDTVIRV